MAAAIWRVNDHQGPLSKHSRSHSSPAAVLGSSSTPPQPLPGTLSDPDLDSDLPEEFSAQNRQSLPSSSQSLVLLHHPARRLTSVVVPQPLQLNTIATTTTTNNSNATAITTANSSYSPTTTSYATLSLLDAVGTGSGRRKLKEFPGYIPLSRYFIPPSASTTPVNANTPTTPTVQNFDTKKSDHEEAGDFDVPDTEATTTPTPSVEGGGVSLEEDTLDTSVQLPPEDGKIDGTTKMEQQPPVAIIGDPEPLMTQDLLNFYKNRLHELEKSTHAELLERISVLRGFLLEHHDATNRLETQLHELQDENTSLSKELEDSVKHRVEMIALVKENEILKEKIDQLSNPKNPLHDHHVYDPTPIPSPDPSVTGSSHSKELDQYDRIQTQYEELIHQLMSKYTEVQSARETERNLANQNIDQLNDRCRRLETAVSDSLKDIIQERTKRVGLEEKLKETEEELNVSVFEMQSQLEIFERHMNESRASPNELDVVHEEEADCSNVIPKEFFEDLPDFADPTSSARASPVRRKTGSPSRRKTPSPTKSRRTPSPGSAFKEQGIQTLESEPKDVRELREELEDMILERQAEEEMLKNKKLEFDAAYEKFATIVDQARAREDDYNHLKIECEELRIQIEELLEQRDLDQEELLNRQHDLDQTFNQLEESLKQGVLDKAEMKKKQEEIDDLRKQLEEADTISVIRDDDELKNLRLQLDETRRIGTIAEAELEKANRELETLRERMESLSKQHSADVQTIEKTNIEIQNLQIQLETLTKQRSSDLETISKANSEIESLRSQVEQSTLANTESTNTELTALREKLAESETAKSSLEKDKSRKDGDIKLLREQMQGLLRNQSGKENELSRVREDLSNLRKRYDDLVSDTKRDEEWRHEHFMELAAVRQRLTDVMRIKDQEHSIHQREADTWNRKDEEYQKKLGEVSARMAEMVLEVNGRNSVLQELNDTIENLKLADEASSVAMGEAAKKIEVLEREVQDEKRKVAVEITKANQKVAKAEELKVVAEEEAKKYIDMVEDLEERVRGYEMAVEATQDTSKRITELEQELAEANHHVEQFALEAMEWERVLEETGAEIKTAEQLSEWMKIMTERLESMANQLETLKLEQETARALIEERDAIAKESEARAFELEELYAPMEEHLKQLEGESNAKIWSLQKDLADAKAHADLQISNAEKELRKLEMQMRVDEAKASATIASGNERIAVLEKQVKTYESLKRHKAQDESDLQSLKSHVVKIERIALQFLPLEDSGMLNAIDELKRSHLETQQKHKKRRKKEVLMAERCGIDL